MSSDTYSKYNKKRVRLCEFSVTGEQAQSVGPALDRLAAHHGGKVPAISAAILDADKKLQKKLNK